MREQRLHLVPRGTLIALVGNPNCGKTALFNRLTGSRQKVANYAGATVEKKEGRLAMPDGTALRVLDLPGVYSLYPRSDDERVACDVLMGQSPGEKRPDALVCVVDATNLRRGLRLVLAVKRLGLPCLVVLNMADLAAARGLKIDPAALSQALDLPVVTSVAVQPGGDTAVRDWLAKQPWLQWSPKPHAWDASSALHASSEADHVQVQAILHRLQLDALVPDVLSDRIDRVVLHPWAGPVILLAVLFLVFQAVFAWATWPMDQIKAGTDMLSAGALRTLPDAWWRDLLVQGLLAGMGGVLVFLPQILILFFFILLLEESGYLPRAAFLLDRIMGGVGLSGRSFIPLLSSFACAVPGIMATRTIANRRDRLVTILIAPLMTCSARLPVYALLIGAFIPAREVWGLQLQGLVLLGLYLLGMVSAVAVAWALKLLGRSGEPAQLMMELPDYHWPRPKDLLIGLWQRAQIFLRNVGGVILALTILLWFLSTFPQAPAGYAGSAIEYSLAGRLGQLLALLFEPIGFNWQIAVALVPGMAAREVVVGALGTVYALSQSGDAVGSALAPLIAADWSLATGLSLLVWFVYAPQCVATLAVVRRETGGWAMPATMVALLFSLAYAASWLTYRLALHWN